MDNAYDEIIDMDDNENENIFTLDTTRFSDSVNITNDLSDTTDQNNTTDQDIYQTQNTTQPTPDNESGVESESDTNLKTDFISRLKAKYNKSDYFSDINQDDYLDSDFNTHNIFKKYEDGTEHKLSDNAKKNIASIAAVIILVLIPVLIFTGIKKSNTSDDADTTNTNKVTSMSFLYSDYNTVTTESELDYETCTSVRFDNVDDLTLYISSSAAYYLSCEKQLETKFNNGNISETELLSGMNEYIEKINNIYHLLTANESVYENNDMNDTYTELTNEINEVIKYGDIIVYNNIQ